MSLDSLMTPSTFWRRTNMPAPQLDSVSVIQRLAEEGQVHRKLEATFLSEGKEAFANHEAVVADTYDHAIQLVYELLLAEQKRLHDVQVRQQNSRRVVPAVVKFCMSNQKTRRSLTATGQKE